MLKLVAKCLDCGLSYDDPGFCDLVISNEAFAKVSPTGDSNGLFCPTCLCRRAALAGLERVPATFRSGPFSDPHPT